MLLYGTAKANQQPLNWLIDLPYIWCRDKDYVIEHPVVTLPTSSWEGVDKTKYNFFELEISSIEENRVLDLRGAKWRDKLLMFVSTFGSGWAVKDSIYKSYSPLDHLQFLGNHVLLASNGYLWATFFNKTIFDDKGAELWFYLSVSDNPTERHSINSFSIGDI